MPATVTLMVSADVTRRFGSILPVRQKETDMNDSPYERFASDALILRDQLAIDRTLLANERTLMAYLRSGVALLIAGVSIIHFSQEGWFWAVGIACIPTGIITGMVGVARYRRMNRSISLVRRQSKIKKLEDAEPSLGTLPRVRGGHSEVQALTFGHLSDSGDVSKKEATLCLK